MKILLKKTFICVIIIQLQMCGIKIVAQTKLITVKERGHKLWQKAFRTFWHLLKKKV